MHGEDVEEGISLPLPLPLSVCVSAMAAAQCASVVVLAWQNDPQRLGQARSARLASHTHTHTQEQEQEQEQGQGQDGDVRFGFQWRVSLGAGMPRTMGAW